MTTANDEFHDFCDIQIEKLEEAGAADLAAIREALDDMAKGERGIPFEEFDREFRKRHNLPAKP